jgi:hypothetical protein
MLDQPETLEYMADYLAIPSEQGGNIGLLSSWKKYRNLERQYVQARFEHFSSMKQVDLEGAMNFLWDGDGSNPNAALTVLRHYDSASVSYGFVGAYPETAWVIDYPLLERIHYMLVAGFNVFGNFRHQLNTRLYMDFLRMEGEDMYLAFLPTTHRKAIRDSWYAGMREGMDEEIRDNGAWMNKDVVTGYKTDDPQRELYQQIERKLANVLKPHDVINRCEQPPCNAKGSSADKRKVDAAMRHIAGMRGQILATFPDVAFIRVRRDDNPDNDFAYTVIRNKAYKNVTSMFADEEDTAVRDYSNDTVTVVDWLEGSYPNFFFTVDIDDINATTEKYAAIQNREDYEKFVSDYGVRRTDSTFWNAADWYHDQYLREKPIHAGLFDLNRYQNR